MRVLNILIIVLLSSLSVSYSASPIYDLIGKNLEELNTEIGTLGQVKQINEHDSISVYQTKIGYQSFIIHNHRVVMINSTSHWETKNKASKAFEYALTLYGKDGFQINKKSKSTAIATNDKFKVAIEISFQNGQHQLIETISQINRKEEQ